MVDVKPGDEEKCEPKENDKCMGNADGEKDPNMSQSKLSEWKQRAKDLSTKQRVALIVLFVFLLVQFIIIIALAVALGRSGRGKPENICHDVECLRVATHLAERRNDSFNPCTDFWSYACGGWVTRTTLPAYRASYSVDDDRERLILHRVHHLINRMASDVQTGAADWKVKRFYTMCMGSDDSAFLSNVFSEEVQDKLGGWHLLHEGWSPQRWERDRVLPILMANYGVHPFFKISVKPNEKSPTDYTIVLEPSGLGLPGRKFYSRSTDDKYILAYKQFIKDLAQLLGATHEGASRLSDDVFYYEKRIAEVTPNLEILRIPEQHYRRLSISELIGLAPSVPWLNLLQAYFPNANIDVGTSVVVVYQQYFQDISSIISSTDNIIMNNYFMWMFASQYAPHLGSSHQVIANEFRKTLDGINGRATPVEEERWEYCVRITSKYLGYAIGAIYVKEHFPRHIHSKVQKVVDEILLAFLAYLDKVDWLNDPSVKQEAREKMKALHLAYGYPEFILDEKALTRYYDGLNVQTRHFRNVFLGEAFLRKKQESLLQSTSDQDYRWTVFPQDFMTVYGYVGNELFVPAGLLDEPLFSPSHPLSSQFGSLGAKLGSKIFQAFDDRGVHYNRYGELGPWLTNRTREIYEQRKECLQGNIGNMTVEDIEMNGGLTVGEQISTIAGIKFAFKAFQSLESKKGNGAHLPGLARSPKEQFFLFYAQSMCQIILPEKVKIDREISLSLPNKLRVLGALQELPEFAEAYGCPVRATELPRQKCNMW